MRAAARRGSRGRPDAAMRGAGAMRRWWGVAGFGAPMQVMSIMEPRTKSGMASGEGSPPSTPMATPGRKKSAPLMTNLLTGAWMGNAGSMVGHRQAAYTVGMMSPLPARFPLFGDWNTALLDIHSPQYQLETRTPNREHASSAWVVVACTNVEDKAP